MSKERLFNIIVAGCCTDKTELILCFAEPTSSEANVGSIGIEFYQKMIEVEGESVKLLVWDVAHQVRFRSLNCSYCRGAHGIVVVFDVADQSSFELAKETLSTINRNARSTTKVLIGNTGSNKGAERAVDSDTAQKVASANGITYLETSVHDNDITYTILTMARDIHQQTRPKPPQDNKEAGISVPTNDNPPRRSHCIVQ